MNKIDLMKTNHRIVLFLILTFLGFAQANAQMAIYDYRGTTNSLGGNGSMRVTSSGSLAMDLATREAIYVGLVTYGSGASKQVYYQVLPLENYLNFQVYGTRNQSYTVMAKSEAPGTQYAGVALEHSHAIGLNSVITIQTIPFKMEYILPRTLKSSGMALTYDEANDYVSQETGSYTLNIKSTLQFNNADLNIEDYIASVRNGYAQKGIQELVLPPAN
jgi:hypothetical protein